MTHGKPIPPRWAAEWAAEIEAKKPLGKWSAFGSLTPPIDEFEVWLITFAAKRGIDADSEKGRAQALEIAARGNAEFLKYRSFRRPRGRPSDDRPSDDSPASDNMLVLSTAWKSLREAKAEQLLDRIDAQRAEIARDRGLPASKVTDARVVRWVVFGKDKTTSAERVSHPEFQKMTKAISEARTLLGRPARKPRK